MHHVIPLHEVGADYGIDPVRDLRPVCPNCHAVLHWKDSFSIEDVERMLERIKGCGNGIQPRAEAREVVTGLVAASD